MANTTGWHYTLLPGNMQVIVSAHWHVIALNLHAYPANRSSYTPENGFQTTIKCQGGPFQALLKPFCSYCLRKLLRIPLITYTQLCAWAHQQSSFAQLSPVYLLSTCMSLRCIESESDGSWVGLGNKANSACATTGVSGYHGYRQAEGTVGKSSLFWHQRLTMWQPQKNLVKIILNHSQQTSACSFVIISALTVLYFLDQI